MYAYVDLMTNFTFHYFSSLSRFFYHRDSFGSVHYWLKFYALSIDFLVAVLKYSLSHSYSSLYFSSGRLTTDSSFLQYSILISNCQIATASRNGSSWVQNCHLSWSSITLPTATLTIQLFPYMYLYGWCWSWQHLIITSIMRKSWERTYISLQWTTRLTLGN